MDKPLGSLASIGKTGQFTLVWSLLKKEKGQNHAKTGGPRKEHSFLWRRLLLTTSTLLVPGYVDRDEVRDLARFVASLDPEIPYSLLAFFPSFELADLPITGRDQAERCVEAAREAGLMHVHLGNEHLLQ